MREKGKRNTWTGLLPGRALEWLLGLAWAGGLLLIASAREGLAFSLPRAFGLAAGILFFQAVPAPERRGLRVLRGFASLLPWAVLFFIGWNMRERLAEEAVVFFSSLLGSADAGAVPAAALFFSAFCALLWAFLVWDAPLSYLTGVLSLAVLVLLPLAGQRPGYAVILLLVLPPCVLLFMPRTRLRALAWVVAALLAALPLGLVLSGPVESGVYALENLRFRATASRDGGAVFTGRISRGNVYRSGIPQLRLTLDRRPEETLYLRAFTGSSYTYGVWETDDEEAYRTALEEVWPSSQWAERMEHLPELLNLIRREGDGMTSRDERIQMTVTPLPAAGEQRVMPYYAMEAPGQTGEGAYGWLFWEKKDMTYRWREDQGRYVEWYEAMLAARKRINERYLAVPESRLPNLAEWMRGHRSSDPGAATAFILWTLETQASYTRNPGQGSLAAADDPIEDFLFERHLGYCQQYASAAVLMYRMSGIPARYVEGYRVGPDDFAETEDGWETELSDESAHAWAELFLQDYGWTAVEVTPTEAGTFLTEIPGVAPGVLAGSVERLRLEALRPEAADSEGSAVNWDSEESLRAALSRFAGKIRPYRQRIAVTAVIYLILAAVILAEWKRKEPKRERKEEVMNQARLVVREVNKAVLGKDEAVREVMLAILAGGHVLLEDAPGVGKTMLAQAFSRAMGLEMRRVQFTPDVLPGDLTGFSVYHKEEERMVFQPGAVFCNLLLADEINRTSPKTQSALLEVMEERQVSVDGYTWEVPDPFVVLATQNPYGSAGTQALPDTELDRFMVSLTLGYPDKDAELELALEDRGERRDVLAAPILTAEGLKEMQKEVQGVILPDEVSELLVDLIRATREHPDLARGASPRATLALVRMAKASAYLEGRAVVGESDVWEQFLPVTVHRVALTQEALRAGKSALSVLNGILKRSVGR